MKTIRLWLKKLKKAQKNGKTSYVHGLEELMLLKCSYYPIPSTDSMQYSSNTKGTLNRNRRNNPEICVKPQKTLSNQSNLEEK